MPFQTPYCGPSRKLIIAFDIGLTDSGVSYCILDPGEVPRIQGVTRYPAQAHVRGDSRIPSILYYDSHGVPRAVGAEALKQQIIEQAEEEEWIRVEWWKFHLRVEHLALLPIKVEDLPPLPYGKTAVQIHADFMRYLFACARSFIVESHASGASMWKSMENDIEFILTYPNGWNGLQQQQTRCAVEIAELISGADKQASRIHLLAEGEASLHFCLHALASDPSLERLAASADALEEGAGGGSEHQGVTIIDAGEGIVELSAYCVELSTPRTFKEITPAECHLLGSTSVKQRAHAFLKAKLANSRYGSPEIVQQMVDIFDTSTKWRIRDADNVQYIKFGTMRDKDIEHGIKSGQLKLAGEDVAKFFEPSVKVIADAFEKQQQAAARLQTQIKHAFLVGGFAASDYLYYSLQQHPVLSEVSLHRPSSHVSRDVADGALISHVGSLVNSQKSDPPSYAEPG